MKLRSTMTIPQFKSVPLNPRQVIENITIKKILLHLPESERHKSLIRFIHTDNKAMLDLALLPVDLARKIEAMFAM